MKRHIGLIRWFALSINNLWKNQNFQILFLSMLSILYFFNILLSTGFISDDAYNSQILGTLLINNDTIINHFIKETLSWFLGSGRILFWYSYFLYYFTQSEVLVKTIELIIMGLGLYFFSLLIGKISKSKIAILFSVICIPAIFQVRAWHDPILAFSFLLPLLFLFLSSSLYYFQCFLEDGRKKFLILSLALHLIALLTYELSYLFFLCHLSLVLFYKGSLREKFFKSLPILILSFSIVLVSILAKTKLNPYFNNGYPGAALHLDPWLTLKTFFYQSLSGLPLSYYLGTNPNLDSLMPWEVLGIYIFFGAVFYCLLKLKTIPKLRFLTLGSTLFFPPAMIIALSGHQEEIIHAGIGYGYLSVYFQYFGFFLIFLSGFYSLRHYLQKWSVRWFDSRGQFRLELVLIFVCAILFTYVAKMHLKQNKAVAKSTNFAYLYPRKTLGTAIKRGLLDPVKNNDLILQSKRYPSDEAWYFATAAKRPLKICDILQIKTIQNCSLKQLFGVGEDLAAANKDTSPSPREIDLKTLNNWVIAYSVDSEQDVRGIVVLAKIDKIILDPGKNEILQIRAGSRLRIFDYQSNNITELSLPDSSVDFLKILNGSLPLSLQKVKFSDYKSEPLVSKWYGSSPPPKDSTDENAIWSSGEIELVLYNLSQKTITVKLSARISPIGEGLEKSNLKIVEDAKAQVQIVGMNSAYLFERQNTLKPGHTSFHFSSGGKVVSEDPKKNIVFGVFNFQITEVGQQ